MNINNWFCKVWFNQKIIFQAAKNILFPITQFGNKDMLVISGSRGIESEILWCEKYFQLSLLVYEI